MGLPDSEDPTVDVVVVNWNSGNLLARCLQSLSRTVGDIRCSVIVIDNASTDDSPALCHDSDLHPPGIGPVRLIQNLENVGFARAVNQGIKSGRAPLILVLNPDTELRPRAISSLVTAMLADTTLAACAPRLLNPDLSLHPSVWPSPPTPIHVLGEAMGLYRLLPAGLRGEFFLGRHWDHSRRRHVRSFSGAAFLVRREATDAVGLMDERFWMYGEDMEWLFRMSRAGWRLQFIPEAEVIHLGGQSARKRWSESERRLHEIRGQLHFQLHCLWPGLVIGNTLSQALVARLARLKGGSSETRAFLDEVVSLQMAGFKAAARAVLRRSSPTDCPHGL